jgi:hypothetical protein
MACTRIITKSCTWVCTRIFFEICTGCHVKQCARVIGLGLHQDVHQDVHSVPRRKLRQVVGHGCEWLLCNRM